MRHLLSFGSYLNRDAARVKLLIQALFGFLHYDVTPLLRISSSSGSVTNVYLKKTVRGLVEDLQEECVVVRRRAAAAVAQVTSKL